MKHEKLIKARAALTQSQPFYGALALNLEFVESANVATTQVNGTTLRYNPTFLAGLRDAQVQGQLAKQALRCGLLHHCRRLGRDEALWQQASNLVVNPLVAESLELLDTDEVREDFTGKSIDEVFSILREQRRQQQEQQQPPQPPQQPEQPEQGEGEGEGDDAGEGEGEGDDAGEGEGEDAGSTFDEEAGEDYPDARELADAGEGEGESAAPSPAELAEQAREWTIISEQAANMAKSAGTLPGATLQAVKANKKAQVDWKEELRRFMSATAKNDFTWARPSRRHISRGMYLPSLRSEQLGEIVIAVDTSGSTMSFRKAFAAEVTAAVEETRPELVHLLECDTRVTSHVEKTPDDMPLSFTMHGGGGTMLGAIFDYIKEREIEPLCVIVLTDLENAYWGTAPDCPVLWVSTMHAKGAPFGEVVTINA